MFITVPDNLGVKPIPEGIYKAIVSGMGLKTSSTGKPMIAITYTLIGGDHAGRKINDNIVLDENVLWRANILYSACTGKNIPAGQYSVDELFQLIQSGVLNKEVLVRLVIELYEGQERNRIKEVRKAG